MHIFHLQCILHVHYHKGVLARTRSARTKQHPACSSCVPHLTSCIRTHPLVPIPCQTCRRSEQVRPHQTAAQPAPQMCILRQHNVHSADNLCPYLVERVGDQSECARIKQQPSPLLCVHNRTAHHAAVAQQGCPCAYLCRPLLGLQGRHCGAQNNEGQWLSANSQDQDNCSFGHMQDQ